MGIIGGGGGQSAAPTYHAKGIYDDVKENDGVENQAASFRCRAHNVEVAGRGGYMNLVKEALASNDIPNDFRAELARQERDHGRWAPLTTDLEEAFR